jgi:hypothetical protein
MIVEMSWHMSLVLTNVKMITCICEMRSQIPPSRVASLPGDSGAPRLPNPKSPLPRSTPGRCLPPPVVMVVPTRPKRRWAGEESLGRGLVGVGGGPWVAQLVLAGSASTRVAMRRGWCAVGHLLASWYGALGHLDPT